MHEVIMAWSSRAFYRGKLIADASVAEHKLSQLPGISSDAAQADAVMVFVDTSGFEDQFFECTGVAGQEDGSKGLPVGGSVTLSNQSKYNEGEAQMAVKHTLCLLKMGLNPRDIAVITPYNAQVDLITSLLAKEEIHSVEVGSGTLIKVGRSVIFMFAINQSINRFVR
jgi:DNA polymerase alpha-associated DNA helicase A